MTKVSVIVPVYNAEKYLNDCIESLVGQSYHNIEIVLVNDGSTDNSKDIIDYWEEKDSRIVCINQENQGVTLARKNGVNESTGEWVTFVDADDELTSNAIELMLNASEESDLVIGHVKMDLNWFFPKINALWTRKDLMRDLLINGNIHWGPVAKLYRRNLIDEYVFNISKRITNGEDYIFNLRYAAKVKLVRIIDEDVYHYIYRNGSATSKNPFQSIRYCLLYEKEVWNSFKGIRIDYLYDYCVRLVKTAYRRFRLIAKRAV